MTSASPWEARPATGLTLARPIYVDDKADYYLIANDLPKFPTFDQPLDPD